MKTQGCAYCCGDLIEVEGILGTESFCPTCRRFQRSGPRFTLPTIRKDGGPTPPTQHRQRPPVNKRQA